MPGKHTIPKRAILSDVHANVEALESVLNDAARNNVGEIVCLGDLIGYGPNPRQALKVATAQFKWTILGNHEEAVLDRPVGFNWKAEASVNWTRDQLLSRRFPAAETKRFWQYVEEMPNFVEEKDVLYVHASPLDPTQEYVLPESCLNRDLMRAIFKRVRRVAFGGHTHIPGIFFPNRPFLPQENVHGPYPVIHGKHFVNVGSVGQPRDGNPRACYVIFDGNQVEFRRVPYNWRKTARKIKRIRRLPTANGARLSLGL